MAAFRHVVLFRLHDAADADAAIRVLEEMRPAEGLVSWTITRSLEDRKGVVIVEDATFVDRAAFEEFRRSEGHRLAVEHMRRCSDWLVGDWTE